MQPLELYIHIPFCVKKCAYCDFLSGPAGEKEKEEYVKMLVDEIRNCPDTVQNYKVISIFFGGGTPSLLTGEQIGRLMDTVREIFTLDEDAEITMEMNPGTVTEEKLRKYSALKEANVFYLPSGKVQNTKNAKADYIVFSEIGSKGMNIGLMKSGEVFVPMTILISKPSNKMVYLEDAIPMEVERLEIINIPIKEKEQDSEQ